MQAQHSLASAGYHLGEPDGKSGPATTTALKKFQTDRHLPVTGKLDAITLAALGVRKPVIRRPQNAADLILPDAVYALVHTVDPDTQEPAILAATNAGLYRSVDPSKGWLKLSYGSFDPRTTCISTIPKQPETIWVGTPSAGVLVSRDSGKTWRQVDGCRAKCLSTLSHRIRTVLTTFMSERSRRSSCRTMVAQSWKVRGGNLPFGDFTSILINPRNGDEVFAGNAYQVSEIGGGVYPHHERRSSWARIDPKGGGYRVKESGRWRLMLTIRTCCLLDHTRRAFTLCRARRTRSRCTAISCICIGPSADRPMIRTFV